MKSRLFLLAVPIMLLAGQTQPNDPAMYTAQQLQREMNAAMQQFQERMTSMQGFGNGMNVPKAELKTEGDHYSVSMEIPGASEKSIDIETKDHLLSVSAQREEVKDVNTSDYCSHERRISSFSRSFNLPDDADTVHLKSDYKNGVLTIIMPKKS